MLKAVLQMHSGNCELIEDWKERFAPATLRVPRAKQAVVVREDESEIEESNET